MAHKNVKSNTPYLNLGSSLQITSLSSASCCRPLLLKRETGWPLRLPAVSHHLRLTVSPLPSSSLGCPPHSSLGLESFRLLVPITFLRESPLTPLGSPPPTLCSLRASHTSLPCPYHTWYLRVRLCDSHLTPPGCKLHVVGTRSVTFPDNPQCLAHHRASAFSNKRKKKNPFLTPSPERSFKPPPPPALGLPRLPSTLKAKSKGFNWVFPGPCGWILPCPHPRPLFFCPGASSLHSSHHQLL